MGIGARLGNLIGTGVTAEMPALDAKMVRATNILALAGAATIGVWALLAAATGEYVNAAENALAAVCFGSALAFSRAGRPVAAATVVMSTLQLQLVWAVYLFGYDSGAPMFYAYSIFGPYLVFPAIARVRAHGFAAVAALLWVASAVFQEHLPQRMVMMDVQTQQIVNVVFVTVGLLFCAAAYAWVIDAGVEALARERARADALLLNVLPPSIAERLKAAPDEPIADRFDEVTVLFADLVGFTPLSATLPARDMVELLNDLFSAFDAICDEHGAEKIKTIGDGYMAICGAPNPREDHALVMARVAIAMQEVMRARPSASRLELRIGLNTGGAVGAIVGRSRFHWDLWGDPVNIAARMESTGEPGRIQIAEATWRQIHPTIPCTPRGSIDVKGKGTMETWFIDA